MAATGKRSNLGLLSCAIEKRTAPNFPHRPFPALTRRLLTYLASFLAGATVWLLLAIVTVARPSLTWDEPVLALFLGMTFPGGAPIHLHFLSHAVQTWVPFLTAFRVAWALSGRRARFSGAVALYAAFIAWSGCMVILHGFGLTRHILFSIGLAGTVLGGLGLFLGLVWPADVK